LLLLLLLLLLVLVLATARPVSGLLAAAASRPSSATDVSRILNFWTLPVTVSGTRR